MRVGVQTEQTLLANTELYVNAFFFTSQSEVDFGIALMPTLSVCRLYPHHQKTVTFQLSDFLKGLYCSDSSYK
jgi:hypothetical protein